MKHYNRVLIGCLMTGIFACNSNASTKENKLANNELLNSKDLSASTNQVKDLIIEKDSECARWQAEPIIRKNIFPNTTFVLQPDNLTAVETLSYNKGDKLKITNWGCEYYVLTFRFETSRFKADTLDLKYWYTAAGKLMNEVRHGIDAPIDIKRGVQVMNNYTAKNANHLKKQTEIDFGGDEIRDFVTLDNIAKMRGNRFAVTISFTTGPL